jgi:hypothetical protein
MTIKTQSPYQNMLIDLMKDDPLPEEERKIFEALLLADDFLRCQDLVDIVFGKDPNRAKGYNKELLGRIREGVEYLQDRAVPIYILHGGLHRLGNNVDLIEYTLQDLESQRDRLQRKMDEMRLYYGRQLIPLKKLK